MRWNNRRSDSEPSSGAASLPLDEISCRAEEPACITGVMASSESAAIPRPSGLPLVRRGHARWLVRAPGQSGALSPEEAAHALKAKRAGLRKRLDWRRDVAGIPEHVRDELVDEAIGLWSCPASRSVARSTYRAPSGPRSATCWWSIAPVAVTCTSAPIGAWTSSPLPTCFPATKSRSIWLPRGSGSPRPPI